MMNQFSNYYHDRDYKIEWLENERLRQENSVTNWIYIGFDLRNNNECKVGLTTGKLSTRASGSQNPYYALLYAFKIKEGIAPQKVKEIENSVINYLSQSFRRINHFSSQRLSEWFEVNPYEIREDIHTFLYDNFSSDMHCYHCDIRDMGVIYSWENNQLLYERPRAPYSPTDLSSPPVSWECYLPGGCGEDCNCWD